jgi:hypothetical protein
LKSGFKQAYGKYPVAYGNVVLMDCVQFLDLIFDELYASIEYLKKENKIEYLKEYAKI